MNGRLFTVFVFGFGCTLGVLGAAGAMAVLGGHGARHTPGAELVVRLHRVSIRPNELDGYRQWQAFLHARHGEALATLAREHMFVEAMFRDRADPSTLYWLEVKDDRGAPVETSEADIDIQHRKFMERVLEPGSWSVLDTDNVLVAPFVADAVGKDMKNVSPFLASPSNPVPAQLPGGIP